MQNLLYKIVIASFLLAAPVMIYGQTGSVNSDLQLADSLFAAGKYTESIDLYESLLEENQVYTNGMLLKMAFIKEGLGEYSQALYYLNLYYAKTSDKRALRKMETIAKQYDLTGYQFSDIEFFRTVYKRYSFHIIAALLALALFTFSYIFWQKRRYQRRPVVGGIFFVILLALLFVVINFGEGYPKAIILSDQAYLRSAPSSGADVVGILDKGNRVSVQNREDVWVKISWEDQSAYIRESHLAEIES
jgi:uncharacterized protein YgiM (DUF1202 family)